MVKVHKSDLNTSDYSSKQLHISNNNKMFLGVLGGFAQYLGVDATLLRIIFILVLIFTGFVPGIVLYFLAALVMPKN